MTTKSLYSYPPKPASWNERDLLLFAASIGCSENDLQYLYELDPQFKAFPTYPIVLTFKHDYTTTTSFASHFTKHLTPPKDFIPGFPALDIQRVVDGERALDIFKPLPITSENQKFSIQSNVVGVWDKGPKKSTIVKTTHDTLSSDGTIYTRMSETAIFMSQGGWNGPNNPTPKPDAATPSSKPNKTYRWEIPRTAHLLYRLNGDYNPLHATQVKEAVVQPTPIMHGLYSWNVAARAVLEEYGGELKSFRAGFARPVRPKDVLDIEMWDMGNSNKGREVRFVAKVDGKVVLSNGVAVLENSARKVKGKL